MKKFAGIKKVFDNINGCQNQVDGVEETDINDHLDGGNFTLAKVGRYGLPYHAISLAVDPVQRLIAIGTVAGAIRICGKPGVEFHVNHEANAPVTLLHFLVNQGGLVSVCGNYSLNIWSIRQKQPALIQSLNFKKEKISALHAPIGSKWLYVGTERGNVYIVNVESFKVSGYVISWNHVIDISHKQSPGPVTVINSNPIDQNKLLINYDSGVCVLWDLRSKKMQCNYTTDNPTSYITVSSWHMEGKQMMMGHYDGSVSTWNIKNPKKPEEQNYPHGTRNNFKDGAGCCPVTKLEWFTLGETPMVIFSGGMPYGNKNKGLTIMRGRSKSLLLSDYVVDFQCLVLPSGPQDIPQPQALFVLLKNEIVVFDLCGSIGPNIPWFALPYTFNIHESPVTCVQFYSECPSDLLAALHGLQNSQQVDQTNQSRRPWPITGGSEGEVNQDPAIIITGHADGSLKFWDATSNMLISCSKISVSRIFDRMISRQSSAASNISKTSVNELQQQYDDPFAIHTICLCPQGRVLIVGCQSHFLTVFKFCQSENTYEISKLDVNFTIEQAQECSESPTSTDPLNGSFSETVSTASSLSSILSVHQPVVHPGSLKWPIGFQPELVCFQLVADPSVPISSIAVSSAYGLVCFGNSVGLAIVDYLQKTTVTVILTYELGVPGEWTDSSTGTSTGNKTPLTYTKSLPHSPHELGSFNMHNGNVEGKKDRHEKKKERASRMLTTGYDQPKHSKRSSFRLSNGKEKDKEVACDNEDGSNIFRDKKDEPASGFINSLAFSYSYTRRAGNLISPSLWVGTSMGDMSVLALSVATGSERLRQPVLVLASGMQLTYSHCVLDITPLDKFGNILGSPFSPWRERNISTSSTRSKNQTTHVESTDRQFLSIVTEKEIIVKTLPSFKRFAKIDPVNNDAFVIKAQTMQAEGGNCIGCLTTDGYFKIYSLPSLRLLLDIECGLSLADYRVIRTFTMGNGGEATFLASPSEIQRIALTKQKEETFLDDHGCLFTMCELPQAKPKGFFESFFTSAPSPLDRDELFGEKSGAVSKSVADYVPGSGTGALMNQADTVAGAAMKARAQLLERGEKLDALSERTEEMNLKASSFASASRALAEKYKKQKWYQF